jgi:hypothetical protein
VVMPTKKGIEVKQVTRPHLHRHLAGVPLASAPT